MNTIGGPSGLPHSRTCSRSPPPPRTVWTFIRPICLPSVQAPSSSSSSLVDWTRSSRTSEWSTSGGGPYLSPRACVSSNEAVHRTVLRWPSSRKDAAWSSGSSARSRSATGTLVLLRGGKPRALLGALLLHANEPVSTARLIDDLWGDEPPASAEKLVQGYVHALRKALGSDALVTHAPGYRPMWSRTPSTRWSSAAWWPRRVRPPPGRRCAARARARALARRCALRHGPRRAGRAGACAAR